jgi:hypothetical protein
MANNENDATPGTDLALASDPGMALLAERLVAAARPQGVQLTGPAGLLTGLTKQVLETALQVEMADHLGYEPGDPSGNLAATPATGPHRKRSAPTSARCVSRSPVIGPARSNRWWCPSINDGSLASTTRSSPSMRKG